MADDARGRARSGLGAWVRSVGTGAGRGLRKASPYGIYAFLTAAAVAPLAGPALGAAGEFEIALNQLGGMGGNHLASVLADTAGRLRARGGEVTDEQWREAVAEALAERLEAPDRSDELVDEVRGVLRAVDGVEHAIAVAAEHAEELHRDLHRAVAFVGSEFGDVRWMLGELRDGLAQSTRVLAELQREVVEQRGVERSAGGFTQRLLVGLTRVRRVLRQEAVRAPDGPCPYPGLGGFGPHEARWFHGRDGEIAELVARVAMSTGPVVVTGASGVGKSSLVRAGVLPALAGGAAPGSEGWPVVVFTPGVAPLRELTARVASVARVSSAVEVRAFGVLARQAALMAGEEARLVIVVDQFEQLFTQCADEGERVAFAEALVAAAPSAVVVVVVRADFFDRCVELPALLPALSAPWVLGAMGEDGLREAISAPAAVESGLVDRLLADLGDQPGEALPLLAHALRATWHRDPSMTLAAYQATGGIGGAVADTAESVYTGLDEAGRDAVRAVAPRLVTLVGDRVLRRRAERSALPAGLLAPWIDARLLTADEHTVQLSHEALITAWPRLRDWVDAAREDIAARQRLDDAAAEWLAQDRAPDALLRGATLAGLLTWADGRADLSPLDRDFLTTSARTQARATRRLRLLAVGLAAALVASLVATGIAVVAGRRADANAADSFSRQLAAESRLDAEADPIGAMRKAVQAWRTAPTPQARGALLSAQMLTYPSGFDTGLDQALALDVSADGRYVAVGAYDGDLVIWDTETGKPLTTITHTSLVADVAFSPDGTLLATLSFEERLRVWSIPDGALVQTVPGYLTAAWRPDGTAIAAIGFREDGALVQSWNPRTGKQVGPLSAILDVSGSVIPTGLTYAADGARIAAGFSDGRVEFWDTADASLVARRATHVVDGPEADKHRVTVAAGADVVASAMSGDDRIVLWDAVTGKLRDEIAALGTPGEGVRSVALHPDGNTMLAAGGPGRVSLFDTASGRYAGAKRGLPEESGVLAVAVSADGRTEVAVTLDGRVTLWRRNTNWYLGMREAITGLDLRRTTVTAVDAGGSVRSWDLRTGEDAGGRIETGDTGLAETVLTEDGALITVRKGAMSRHTADEDGAEADFDGEVAGSVALSPDGTLLAVPVARLRLPESTEYAILVRDAVTLAHRAEIPLRNSPVNTLAFTPTALFAADGARLVTWNTADFTERWSVEATDPLTTAAAVAPDGTLLTAGTRGVIEIRDPDTGAVVGEFGEHPTGVRAIAVSPDNTTVATISTEDSVVRLWDLSSRGLLAELTGHRDAANEVVFSADGAVVVTGGGVDTDVAMWRVRPEDAVERICANLAQAGSGC